MKFVVLLGAVAIAVPLTSFAQSTAGTIADEVVVTATRFPAENRDLPIGVSVITAQDIARSTSQTLPQLLSLRAGIQIRDASGSPDQQVDMRGFGITGDQNTLVLLDGQRLSENELTSARWSSVPLDSIERIEILRGSGAVLYGGGATGGVINIVTKAPKSGAVSGQASALGGSYGTFRVEGGAAGGGENVAANVYASYYGSDNYRENNRVSQSNATADLRWFDATSSLSLRAFGGEQNLDLPGALTAQRIARNPRAASTPNDSSTLRGWGTILSGRERIGDGELALDATYRNRDANASILFFGNTFNTETDVDVWTLSPRGRFPYALFGLDHTLVAGWDATWWNYSQNRDFGPARLKANQTDYAVYAQQTSQLTPSTLFSYGGRVQTVERFAQDRASFAPYAIGSATGNPVAWEFALRQGLVDGLAAFGKYGRSFRVPNVDELFQPVWWTELRPGGEQPRHTDLPRWRDRARVCGSEVFDSHDVLRHGPQERDLLQSGHFQQRQSVADPALWHRGSGPLARDGYAGPVRKLYVRGGRVSQRGRRRRFAQREVGPAGVEEQGERAVALAVSPPRPIPRDRELCR